MKLIITVEVANENNIPQHTSKEIISKPEMIESLILKWNQMRANNPSLAFLSLAEYFVNQICQNRTVEEKGGG